MYEISLRSAVGMIIDRGKDKLSEINISQCQLLQHAYHIELPGNKHVHSWRQEYMSRDMDRKFQRHVQILNICVPKPWKAEEI
jgi:hypothetical protein